MSSYGLIYRSTMCTLKIYASNFVAISIFMIFYEIIAFSLKKTLCKKNNYRYYTLLNTCKKSLILLLIDASTSTLISLKMPRHLLLVSLIMFKHHTVAIGYLVPPSAPASQ